MKRWRQWGAAGICLLTLLSSLSWVRLGAVAIIAMADRSHSLKLSSLDRHLVLVLRHDRQPAEWGASNFESKASPRHGTKADLLTVPTYDASSRADHLLRIDSGGSQLELTVPSNPTPELADLLPCTPVVWAADQWGSDPLPTPRTRPPPGDSLLLAQLRATVLLI